MSNGAKGDRYNEGKPPITILMEAPEAIRGLSFALEYGANKYARRNWQGGMPWTQIMDCLLRHTLAFLNGEDIDEESGIPHVDLMQCNTLFLAENFRQHKELDDRGTVNGETKLETMMNELRELCDPEVMTVNKVEAFIEKYK